MSAVLKVGSLGFLGTDGVAASVLPLYIDPAAGAGFAADVGSVGLRNNSGTGEIWRKVGIADTAWVLASMAATRIFRVTLSDPLDQFTVDIPMAMPSAHYAVKLTQANGDGLFQYQAPEVSRTTTSFSVILSGTAPTGTSFDVVVTERNPENDVTISAP